MSSIWQVIALALLLCCCLLLWLWRKASRRVERVRKSRQRSYLLWKHLPNFITEIDQEGRIVDINRTAEGYERDKLIGTLSTDYLSPEFAEIFCEKLKAAVESQSLQTYEVSIPGPDGNNIVMFNQLVPVVINKQLQTLIVISSDVTEQIKAREVLEQQRDQAEEANMAKSRFLASMSHEIRTPMNGLLGMVSLLEQTKLDNEQQSFLKIIQSSSDHLLAIINDILDISKIEANKLLIEEEAFNIRDLVEGLLGMVSSKAQEKSLVLQSFVEEGVPADVIGDSVRIRQVLMNFLTNAIKFTNQGHVLLRVVVVGKKSSQIQLRFSVEDSGIGIEADKAMHLFDEYTFAHGRLSTLEGGTGLGLSISRRLAQLMNGKVGVISSPDVGSNFWLDMELTIAAADEPVVLLPVAQNLNKQRLWIADEVKVNRALVLSAARRLGCEMQDFNRIEDLSAALLTNKPDVLVISQRLQNVLRGEKSIGLEGIRVVVTFAGEINLNPQQLKQQGVHACWEWPVNEEKVRSILTRVASSADEDQLITEHSMKPAAAQEADESIKGKRILLVEDNLVNQKVAGKMLLRLGCNFDVADNGEQGVAAWQQGCFDLILMDCHMPEMDGIEATREIRAAGGADIPILALSADVMGEQKQACLKAGMNDYLAKPIRLDELRQALIHHLT